MGKQINFFMMQEELYLLENKVKEMNFIFIANRMISSNIDIIKSFTESQTTDIYLVLNEQTDLLQINYNEIKKNYYILPTNNPIIEFSKSLFCEQENTLRRGRIYYNNNFNNISELEKNKFLKSAEVLFNWFRKNFKNTKINIWHTTPKVKEWLNNSNGKLIDMTIKTENEIIVKYV